MSSDGRAEGVRVWSAKLMPGLSVGVWYDADEDLWHERLCLWPAGPLLWYVCTPDMDKYVESFACKGEADSPTHCFVCKTDGTGIAHAEGRFYRFNAYPDPKLFIEMLRDAKAVCEAGDGDFVAPTHIVDMRGKLQTVDDMLGAPDTPTGVMVAQGGGVAKKPKPDLHSLRLLPSQEPDGLPSTPVQMAQLADFSGQRWVATESVGDVEKGSEVKMVDGDVALGDRGVHSLGGDLYVSVKRQDERDVKNDNDDDSPDDKTVDDARLLGPLLYDAKGRRHMKFEAGVKQLTEEALADYPLEGERTAAWLYDYVVEHGPSFDARHTRWMVEQHVEKDTFAANIHDLLGLCLSTAITYDQVDPSNLACLEVVCRAYQLVEETGGSLVIEGFEHYVGRSQGASLRRGIALAPTLAKHAVDRQAAQTNILKERRKAREEQLAEKTAKGNPKGGGRAQKPP